MAKNIKRSGCQLVGLPVVRKDWKERQMTSEYHIRTAKGWF